MMKNRTALAILVGVAMLAMLIAAPFASAAVGVNSEELREAVTGASIMAHLQAFQDIATANGGNRASGTPGYDASVEYVEDQLLGAGYLVARQTFQFPYFEELLPPVLEQVFPTPTTYTEGTDFATMEYSGSGNVTATVQAVDLLLPPTGGSTSGCEASDFIGFTPGKIALIQRGTCTFALKALNAQNAGAVGVIIFNEGNTPGRVPLFFGTLGGPGINIPVVSASFTLGTTLNDLIDDGLSLYLFTSTLFEVRTTSNVLAETPGGRDDRVVVVGAHLDSAPEGPGINDNGSGVATILEIALQMDELGIEPRNKVRFAFWGAEEAGLVGSYYYVGQLSKRDVKNIALNLNFDMIASPNYALFVYDGDGSPTGIAGPTGSANIEDIFLEYFASQELVTFPTAMDGRSDYQPFFDVGIPVGGLFTGAEGLKTAEQVELYGGTADQPYDSCYHTPCDDIDNINAEALDYMSDAAAHAILTFAMTTSAVPGTAKASTRAIEATAEFRGPLAQK